MDKYGALEIKLKKLMDEKGLNRNKVCNKAEMNWKQVDNYYNNNVTRLDTFVLCKLCTVLDCKIEDLIEFVPNKKQE